jgi:hypothetical protein
MGCSARDRQHNSFRNHVTTEPGERLLKTTSPGMTNPHRIAAIAGQLPPFYFREAIHGNGLFGMFR